jgi:hypothetical protein
VRVDRPGEVGCDQRLTVIWFEWADTFPAASNATT